MDCKAESVKRKQAAWNKVTNKLNSQSNIKWDPNQVKKSWQNMASKGCEAISAQKKSMKATEGGKPAPSLTPELGKISAIHGDDNPILSGMESGFDSFEPISEPALLSLEESNLLHESELKEAVVKPPEEKKRKVNKVVCASVVPKKEDLTCEVLKAVKDKLLAETAYYVQKTKESMAVEMVAIAKRIYYENLNQNQYQQNDYMNHHITLL
uniref:Nuclear apoptosis-inducing factor 1 n=1 Tax=Romanomermis culicivorax TaxID=13658 RepID=A0A915HYR0_ROMCU